MNRSFNSSFDLQRSHQLFSG